MNRRSRTDLSTKRAQLVPKVPNLRHVQNCLKKRKVEQKNYYDRSARTKKPLQIGDQVRVYRDKYWQKAIVIDRDEAQRSYHVETSDGSVYRRNRRHLIEIPSPVKKNGKVQVASENSSRIDTTVQSPQDQVLRTRYGRVITKPKQIETLKLQVCTENSMKRRI